MDTVMEVKDVISGEMKSVDYRPNDSNSDTEEGSIMSREEEEIELEKGKSESHRSLHNKNVQGTNTIDIWNNFMIERAGNVPSTLADWEKFCQKYSKSNEESFSIRRQETVEPTPSLESMGSEEETCKYSRREQYQREDLQKMAEGIVKFNESLTDVGEECLSYVQCLDP